jgi:hypothetical protein
MAKRLSGRQVLDIILADESDPEDIESSDDENLSIGSEYQLDLEEETDDDSDEEDSETTASDDDILYSITETHGDSDPCVSKSSKEKWSPNAPAARQARVQNVVKGQIGPTSFAKQRV